MTRESATSRPIRSWGLSNSWSRRASELGTTFDPRSAFGPLRRSLMQLRSLVRGLILSVIALWFVGALAGLLGCSGGADPMDAAALRRQFPGQAEEVLKGRFTWAPGREGFTTEGGLR